MPGYFITGTDTGVGKTVITGLLAAMACEANLKTCVYKPIQTGIPHNPKPGDELPDIEWLDHWIASPCLTLKNTYTFEPPAAPYPADPDETIEIENILEMANALESAHDFLLIEGAGGVRVPIQQDYDMADLIQALKLPAIVVCRPNLGTINHTALTIEALQHRKIPVAGVVINSPRWATPEASHDFSVETLLEVFHKTLPVPILAWVPPIQLKPGCFPIHFDKLANLKALVPSGKVLARTP